MKLLHKMLEALEEEVEGAKEYAEKYIESRARGNMTRANKYKEMANDEIKHAGYIRDMNIMDADELKKVYTISEEDETAWEHGHKRLNEEIAMVKQMLM
jgi:DNA-binding transcriptional regulator YiaG